MAFARHAEELPPEERPFVQDLTYGATRMRGRLDHLLGLRVDRGLDGLEPVVLEILRLGAYQLLHMDSVPRYAAVSQSVEQAREEGGKGAAGLVNAVLRAVADAGDACGLFPDFATDPEGFLATWGSHPRWLVRRWLDRWAADEVRRLVELDLTPPETLLFPLDEAPEPALARLTSRGVRGVLAGPQGAPGIRLARGQDPRAALEALPAAVIQDPAAHLVTRYAAVPAGTKIADLCAAPGGKALVLSGGALYTLAADPSELRMRMVQENVLRTGRRVGMVVADARTPPLKGAGAVVLDVPCTGTGTLRRHPDAAWRLRPESVSTLAALQDELLAAAAPLVEPGGLLVYATCSLEPEENRERVRAFLSAHRAFVLDPGSEAEEHVDAEGFLEVLPQTAGFDGAFAARLRKAA